MTSNPPTTRPRFSPRAFAIVAIFHAVTSVALGGLSFLTAMAAFTENVSSEIAFYHIIGWLWTPPQMLALRHPSGEFGLGGLLPHYARVVVPRRARVWIYRSVGCTARAQLTSSPSRAITMTLSRSKVASPTVGRMFV